MFVLLRKTSVAIKNQNLNKSSKKGVLCIELLKNNNLSDQSIDGHLFNAKIFLKLQTGRNIPFEDFLSPVVSYFDVIAIVFCDFLPSFDISSR